MASVAQQTCAAHMHCVQALTQENLKTLTFSSFRRFDVAGIPVWCTRTGWVVGGWGVRAGDGTMCV